MNLEDPDRIRPEVGDYAPYAEKYVSQVGDEDILDALESQAIEVRDLLESIPTKEHYRVHAPYKWTIVEVIGHCIDAERVFGYRAHRIAAGDTTELPGFDQDIYVPAFNYSTVQLTDLLDEWVHMRRSHILFFHRLLPDQWDRAAVAGGSRVTTRALAFCLVGHMRHHMKVIKQRIANA